MMELLDIINTVVDYSQHQENTCEEIKMLKNQLMFVEEYCKDIKVVPIQCKPQEESLKEEIEKTKILLQIANKNSQKKGFFKIINGLQAILPNNILSQLKEQKEKIKENLDVFKQMYELCTDKNSKKNQPQKPSVLPATIIDPDNAIGPTMVVDDDEDDDNQDSDNKIKIKFEFNGDQAVSDLLADNNLNKTEQAYAYFDQDKDNTNEGNLVKNVISFGRNQYLSMQNDLKMIQMISGTHTVFHVKRVLIDQQQSQQQQQQQKPQQQLQQQQQKDDATATNSEDEQEQQQQTQTTQSSNQLNVQNNNLNSSEKISHNSDGKLISLQVPEDRSSMQISSNKQDKQNTEKEQKKEQVFATVQEDFGFQDQDAEKVQKYKYTYYLENQGGNGTSVYKQRASNGIKANTWTVLKKNKGVQQVEIDNGDSFAILFDKKNLDIVIISYKCVFEQE